MCGIIGYIGKQDAVDPIITGLGKLEYRGYDSAGIATINNRGLSIAKCKGRISNLEGMLKRRRLAGSIGIGHTRWATHGRPSTVNAHPHTDCQGKIAVVHNGIIENFAELKKELENDGCRFRSQTDTEVIAHLIGKFYKSNLNLQGAVTRALGKLKGSYALGVISADEPDKIVAARYDSALAIGLGRVENFVVSDVSAVLNFTRKVIYLQDNQIALIKKDSLDIFDVSGRKVTPKIDTVSYTKEEVQKSGYAHFMLKEIHEQPQILSRIVSHYVGTGNKIKFESLDIDSAYFKKVENIIIVACGTAYHAGLIGKYIIESFGRIPVWADLGSEFRYRNPIIKDRTLVIAISQSGETADTLAAVREARRNNIKVLSVCNVVGSALARDSDAVLYTRAGAEISVASTKAFTAQVMLLYLLGLYLAQLKGTLNKNYITKAIASLRKVPQKQKEILNNSKSIKAITKKHLHFGAFLYLGRNINYPVALEGALKLKEISYIPAEGYPAGEMKHGPIALIDEYRAVVCIANDSSVYDKMISNIQEILARKGKIAIIATSGNSRIKDYAKEVVFIPEIEEQFSPLLTAVPLQLFAYYMASLKGYDVDKPRNLAKSVTVE